MRRSSLAVAGLTLWIAGAARVFATPIPIPREQLGAMVDMQLREMEEQVRERLRDDPAALRRALTAIKNSGDDFRARVKTLGDQPNYPIEAAYVRAAFQDMVLPKFRATMAIMEEKGLADDVRQRKLQSLDRADAQLRKSFELGFQRKYRKEIQEVVDARLAVSGAKVIGDATAPEPLDKVFDRFKEMSPLITAGIASVNTGVNGPAGDKPDKPGGGKPSGSKPSAGDWGDVLRRVTTDAPPKAMAGSAGEALLAGRYSEAADMARNALKYDPTNKDAMAVLHEAEGRDAGAGASAAGLAAAKTGAAGMRPSDYGGERPGGAAPLSPEIAALAAGGASRLATEQAENAARSAMKIGDAQGALDVLNKALALDPNNAALLGMRAQAYGRLGRWEEAMKDAAAGLALAPGSKSLLNTLAVAQNRTHRYREAAATADRLIAADPRDPWGYANRAHARAGLGDKAGALSDINRAAFLDPSFREAAEEVSRLQLPSSADIMFLFPGEGGKGESSAPAPVAGRGRNFGVMIGAAIGGGLLIALGLLSLVLAPVKDSVVSVFTKSKRRGPSTGTAPVPAATTGGLIRGQYEISRQIGAGGMGMVYEGTDRSLGRRVAIKKMRDELRLNGRERERFVIEAKTVASLHHPNIVDIYAIAEEGEDVYLVFEYVDGKTVHDVVQDKGRLDPGEAVRIARGMSDALTYAHEKGVIHRDMKPSNVMLTKAGLVKVMDFGIARMAKDALTRYSMTQNVVGTPPYMAPEQEQGVVRKESDVYALAICAYEMLTGKLPFAGVGAGILMNKINMSYIPPSRNIAGLPEALDAVFERAFQADPERRYRSPQEFVAALEGAAGGARVV